MRSAIEASWYQDKPGWTQILAPLECLYRRVVATRFQRRIKQLNSPPVIVVGNISVGGTGKTPCVQALVLWLRSQGLRPGIISRGYGSQSEQFPLAVDADTDVTLSGDETKMLALACQCPVVIDPNRKQALLYITEHFDVDIVISDDGLQHYGLPRAIEIAVIDGKRGLGNKHCLPVGPLREPEQRLTQVDLVLQNGLSTTGEPLYNNAVVFTLTPVHWVNVKTGERLPLQSLTANGSLCAVAAIGNPQRFFDTLTALALPFDSTAFADHHQFTAQDFAEYGGRTVVMTEKDAVKCAAFAADNWWYLKVQANIPEPVFDELTNRLALRTNSSPFD
ncbi:tetraacyldisaccharide 4'-kinase [Halioxenophilus aromaticivorans]